MSRKISIIQTPMVIASIAPALPVSRADRKKNCLCKAKLRQSRATPLSIAHSRSATDRFSYLSPSASPGNEFASAMMGSTARTEPATNPGEFVTTEIGAEAWNDHSATAAGAMGSDTKSRKFQFVAVQSRTTSV